MPRKNTEEGKDFNRLQELGFEFESPQDEFSYQPSSGGAHDGTIGSQEYGINANLDQNGEEILEGNAGNLDERLKKALEMETLEGRKVLALLRRRILEHPDLNVEILKISLHKDGSLMIDALTENESDTIRLQEVAEAVAAPRVVNFKIHSRH